MGAVLTRVGTAAGPLPRPLSTLVLPRQELHSAVVLPDGDTCVVSAENDGTLYVASLGEERVVDRLSGHEGPVNSLALGGGGRLLLSASDDATIRVWDTRSWQVTAVLEGHTGYIREVAAQGMTAVSGGEDGTFRVWDLDGATCRGVFDDHGGSVDRVAISPDGRRAASASRANQVFLWDLDEPRLERELYSTGQVVHQMPNVEWLGDTFLLTGGNQTGVGHDDSPSALLFDPTRDRLYTAADEVICWDLADGRERARFPRQKMIRSLAVHPDLPLLAVGSLHGIQITDLDGEHVASLGADSSFSDSIALLADGRIASVHNRDGGTVRLWPAPAGEERQGVRHNSGVDELVIGPGARWAATADQNDEVFLWDLSSGARIATVTGTREIACRPFSMPGGDRLVIPEADRLHVLPTTGGDPVQIPAAEPEDWAHICAAAPIDDDSVLVAPYDTPPEVWSLGDGERCPLRGDSGLKSRGTLAVTGHYALVPAALNKEHPLIAPMADKVTPFGIPALQCWDLSSGELAWTRHGPITDGRTWPCHNWVLPLRDGTAATLTGYGEEASLLVLDVPTGDVLRQVPVSGDRGEPPTELPDGTLVFVVCEKEAVHLRELAPGADRLEHRLSLPPAASVQLAPGADLLFRMHEHALHLHRLSTGEQLATEELPATGDCLTISSDGGVAVIGDREGGVHIFHVGPQPTGMA
ncbi:WD40 repeat domain-containing protein [Spirillospora sp. NBC_01491]|uniref:WD40 repeat domain-containing protein n=1 Tax=Spirillospora sp. NBC_01491 TaxID=2976007 RepID=UPI002E37D8A8|nr:hypothetical protein [Spirillospora sp. NBC_01491]